MANLIYIKSSQSTTAAPTAADASFKVGELAINTADGIVFMATKTASSGGAVGDDNAAVTKVGMPIVDSDGLSSSDVTLSTTGNVKAYVDAAEARAAQGLQVKANAVATTTGAWAVTAAHAANTITLQDTIASGGFTFNESTNVATLDGVTLAENDIVLVKDALNANGAGSSTKSCGLYVVGDPTAGTTLVLTRHTDMDADGDFSNAFVFVSGGAAARSDTGWITTVDEGTQTVGTTLIPFAQFNSAGTVTAGTSISKVGNVLNVDDDFLKNVGDDSTSGKLTTTGLLVGPIGTSAGNTGELVLKELAANGAHYTGFKAADSLAGTVMYTLPTADGSNGQVLSTNSSGTLAWSSAASSDVDVNVANLEARLVQIDTATTIGDGVTMTMGGALTVTGDLIVNGNDISYDAAASTLGVAAATGSDTASGALTLNAGTGTGDEIGGAITLKTGGAVVDTIATTPTVLVNALVLAADGEATFDSTVNATTFVGALTGAATGLSGTPNISVGTIGATGLITCDDILAESDAKGALTVNASYIGGLVFTPGGATEFNGTSAHPMIAGMTINPNAVTNDATATTTISTTLHIPGLPTGEGTTKYSLFVGDVDGTVSGRIGGAIISGGTF